MTRWTRHKEKKVPAQGSKWEHLKNGVELPAKSSEMGMLPNLEVNRSSCSNHMTQLSAVQRMAIKKNKRTDNRKLKRQRRKIDSMVCFHCRMPGHGMADCPRMLQDSEQGTGICFKCGSTEHNSHSCSAKVPAGKEFAFAKCFVCGEQGHLSKSCPDNPRGLYPSGGCCKLCGSVDHYQKDCPERRITGEVTAYRLQTGGIGHGTYVSVDDEVTLYESDDDKKKSQPAKKAKVVHF